jgi:hypothetical protein
MLGWGLFFALTLARVSGPAQRVLGTAADGRVVTSLAGVGTRAVALFFVATDCPISDRTFPEMKRVREEFARRGVKVWFVYANDTEKRDDVKRHQAEFDEGGEWVMDSGALTELAGAKVTPEAVVLVPDASGWRVVYRGRVDDKYVRLGLERPKATRHFAAEAIGQVLAGKPVEAASGELVGCGIVRPKGSRQ